MSPETNQHPQQGGEARDGLGQHGKRGVGDRDGWTHQPAPDMLPQRDAGPGGSPGHWQGLQDAGTASGSLTHYSAASSTE